MYLSTDIWQEQLAKAASLTAYIPGADDVSDSKCAGAPGADDVSCSKWADTCMMPSRGWNARPAKGLSASCLLYWWCMWCSDLHTSSNCRCDIEWCKQQQCVLCNAVVCSHHALANFPGREEQQKACSRTRALCVQNHDTHLYSRTSCSDLCMTYTPASTDAMNAAKYRMCQPMPTSATLAGECTHMKVKRHLRVIQVF